jgi:hypothetical protein
VPQVELVVLDFGDLRETVVDHGEELRDVRGLLTELDQIGVGMLWSQLVRDRDDHPRRERSTLAARLFSDIMVSLKGHP